MDNDKIRQAAYRKWEEEGRPQGQAERHWFEAEQETDEGDLPKTWSSEYAGGVVPPENGNSSSSEAVPSEEPGSFKPGELASENK